MFKTAKDNAWRCSSSTDRRRRPHLRGAGVGGGSDEREQTLNQILSEMDGFQPNESVIVIAATNRPTYSTRRCSGRAGSNRHVTIDRPTWQGRLECSKCTRAPSRWPTT